MAREASGARQWDGTSTVERGGGTAAARLEGERGSGGHDLRDGHIRGVREEAQEAKDGDAGEDGEGGVGQRHQDGGADDGGAGRGVGGVGGEGAEAG
eukprot:scaffold1112_cov116-Isochrysis_galbana.AAC.16